MRAVVVTQRLKDNNAIFTNDNVGDIVIKSIPNIFYRQGEAILGYNFNTEQQDQDGFKDVVRPQYNSQTQKLGNLIESENTFTYEVLDLTQDEIEERIINNSEAERLEKLRIKSLEKVEGEFQAIADESEMLENKDFYPFWKKIKDGYSFEVGKKVQDFDANKELKLYKVIQGHNKQSDWNPKDVPALFNVVEVAGATEWQEGVAYVKGDVRTYESVEYKCLQGHTSQVGWQPPNVPALWALNK
jgi:hypothetical protein